MYNKISIILFDSQQPRSGPLFFNQLFTSGFTWKNVQIRVTVIFTIGLSYEYLFVGDAIFYWNLRITTIRTNTGVGPQQKLIFNTIAINNTGVHLTIGLELGTEVPGSNPTWGVIVLSVNIGVFGILVRTFVVKISTLI